jgi:N-acetylneuraminic acid mutarotase
MKIVTRRLLLAIHVGSCLFFTSCGSEDDPTENTDPVITSLSPLSGPEGSTVNISGKNFDPTASLNSVAFNNKSATVTAASSTELSVVVPVGATTGNVTVGVNGKVATSAQVFTVTVGVDNKPVITAFAPSTGAAGTSVTITGSKFSSTVNQNEVKFNGITATVSSATTTQLVVTVPATATTGTISVKVAGLIGISAVSFTVTSAVSTQWAAKADFGGNARAYAVGFAIGNKGYIGMGMNFITPYQDFWEYDATGGAWTQKANFGGGKRYKAASFVIGSKAYVATGVDEAGNEMKDLWEYDQSLNTWTKKADYAGTMMYGGFGFTIDGKGYVGSSVQMYAYDPANNSWTQKKNYEGSGETHSASFVIGNKGYVGTGYGVIVGETSDFWEYDATLNDWTQKADVPGNARGEGIGFAVNGKGYIGLGSFDMDDFYEFNPTNNTWTQKSNFGKAGGLYAAAAFVIGDKGYVGTGNDADVNASKSFFEFDPTK